MSLNHMANCIAVLNLAAKQRRVSISVRKTRLICSLLSILIEAGYVTSFTEILNTGKLSVTLRYTQRHEPVLRSIQLLSKPGNRVYFRWKQINFLFPRTGRLTSEFGILILLTPRGIMTHHQAVNMRLGGEGLVMLT